MIISVNTDKMNELANLAASVSAELSEACACLSPVTVHDDWNCAERDVINEAIQINKKSAADLMNCAENFSSAMTKTAESFTDFELKNPLALQSLKESFSKTISIYTPNSGLGRIVGPGGMMPRPFDLPILDEKHVDPFVLYPLYTWDKPIRMIDILKYDVNEVLK